MPAISVIVPIYNVEKYLNRCVDSILNQTFTDFELILVDDGSTDRSGYICDEYEKKDKRVRVIHKKNGGVSSARNTALGIISGEYVTFCDSDDYVKSDWLETMYYYSIKKGLDCVSIGFTEVNDSEILSERIFDCFCFSFDNYTERINFIKEYVLLVRIVWAIYTKLFKADIILKNNINFCETCENFAEDMAFVLEFLMCSESIGSIEYCGYYYYQRDNSMMHNSVGKIKLNALNEVSKHFYDFLVNNVSITENKKILSAYPLIHCLIMLNQVCKIRPNKKSDFINEAVNSIDQIKWYKKMLRKIPKYYKELTSLYGKQMAFEYFILLRYTVHKSYKRYCFESGIYYKFFNR